jgi:MFS transporter, DHA1 family, tetracycline resistance protein
LSGLFSATFPLTFAYIADCVPPNERAPAYGLALATLGLSFTIGPPLGGYIDSNFGSRSVFILSFALVLLDLLYILFILPETVQDNVC